jgi:RNA polymerase sigma factor (sigma-70 family)
MEYISINQFSNSYKHPCVIEKIYEDYYYSILKYIRKRTNNDYLSEDLTQDVFIRLIDYEGMISPATVKSFVFTVAKNITIDFLRHKVKQPQFTLNEFEEFEVISNQYADSKILYEEIIVLEKSRVNIMSTKRKKIYSMSRYNEMSVSEIAETFQISKRTVECHLFSGRKEVREYIWKCI